MHHSRKTVTSPRGQRVRGMGRPAHGGNLSRPTPHSQQRTSTVPSDADDKGPAPALLVLMTHTPRGWTPRGHLNMEGKED